MKISNSAPRQARSRILSVIMMGLVISVGLALRSRMIPLPHVIIKYGGDALWALMVFFAVGCIFVRAPTMRVGLIAFCICCGVELSQLYYAPWIDAVRNTRLGAFAIGSTFNWPDFLAYAAGVGIGLGIDAALIAARGISGKL